MYPRNVRDIRRFTPKAIALLVVFGVGVWAVLWGLVVLMSYLAWL